MNKTIKSIFSKIALFTVTICVAIFAGGCSIIDTGKNNSTSNKTESALLSQITSSESVQVDSALTSAAISVQPVHSHVYNLKKATADFVKTQPTAYTDGVYYYSCVCGAHGTETFTTAPIDLDYSIVEEYIDRLLSEGSATKAIWNKENSDARWDYINGCMMTSFLKMYDYTKEDKYLDFVDTYIDYFISDTGSIGGGYSKGAYELDDINEGRVLFDLYDLTDKEYYRKAIDVLVSQLASQPRTSSEPKNSFWHKERYTEQIWLDGLYMAQPFNLRYITTYGDGDYSDVMNQYANVENYMKDKITGLYYHGLDVKKVQSWADSETGLSKSFWLRAMGWYIASLSDVYMYLPSTDTISRKTISGYLKNAVDSVLVYLERDVVSMPINRSTEMRDATYMFYQVVDKGGQEDNYLETSGSALISYALMNGANCGALTREYYNYGKAIFNGICSSNLVEDSSGNLQLNNICKVGGLGSGRDGSYEYYTTGESIVSTEGKGVAPFIMAYVELLKGKQ